MIKEYIFLLRYLAAAQKPWTLVLTSSRMTPFLCNKIRPSKATHAPTSKQMQRIENSTSNNVEIKHKTLQWSQRYKNSLKQSWNPNKRYALSKAVGV